MENISSLREFEETDQQLSISPSLAEISLRYKARVALDECPTVNTPQKAVELLREVWDSGTMQLREEFVVLLLNNAKKCLGWCKISTGGATATIVDPATIFQVALLANAKSIILAHNHPSGNTEPSRADKKLTERIIKSGKLLGINVDDHIIITSKLSISFKSKGII